MAGLLMNYMAKSSETWFKKGLMQIEGDRVRMTKRGLFLGDTVAERFIWSRIMGLTYQMKMKIPFDMADMNGHIKLPDVVLLSLQVSGMQSIELGVGDKTILENYNFSLDHRRI